jgi:hypothetical protein
LSANKITRRQLGRLTEPGRYALSFGWLTITAEDLAVWEKFPNAAFTLVKTASAGDDAEEFRLGSFEMGATFHRGQTCSDLARTDGLGCPRSFS